MTPDTSVSAGSVHRSVAAAPFSVAGAVAAGLGATPSSVVPMATSYSSSFGVATVTAGGVAPDGTVGADQMSPFSETAGSKECEVRLLLGVTKPAKVTEAHDPPVWFCASRVLLLRNTALW